jgi:hypothetical protein
MTYGELGKQKNGGELQALANKKYGKPDSTATTPKSAAIGKVFDEDARRSTEQQNAVQAGRMSLGDYTGAHSDKSSGSTAPSSAPASKASPATTSCSPSVRRSSRTLSP